MSKSFLTIIKLENTSCSTLDANTDEFVDKFLRNINQDNSSLLTELMSQDSKKYKGRIDTQTNTFYLKRKKGLITHKGSLIKVEGKFIKINRNLDIELKASPDNIRTVWIQCFILASAFLIIILSDLNDIQWGICFVLIFQSTIGMLVYYIYLRKDLKLVSEEIKNFMYSFMV